WAGVRWRLMAQGLAPLMSARPFGVAAPGREAELERGMRALAEALADFVKWIDELHARHPDAWGRFALPPEDERRARALELSLSFPDEPGPARVVLARFVLLGELYDGAGASLTIAPPLAVIDPAWDRRARAALAEAVALGHAKARTREHGEHEAIVALEVLAEVELLGGRQEEAVRALQAALDRYPRARSFERIERRIKALLGIEPDATTRDLESWARGLAGCLDMSLRVGIDKIIYQRTRARGLAALAETVDEVERACAGQPSMTRFWDYLYARVARELGKHGRCAEFETWMAKAIAAGASPGDVEGWRRNWTECPLPPGAPPRR
ncbi:MAG: hypothetical protein IT385_26590, partial [Deltaproteobacteria bacterium]|nr:hypothetical protein [Deltaproteobacteria bacterium]